MGDFFKIESESLIKSRLRIPRSYCIRKGGFMHEDATCNDLQEIITQAINEIKQEQGEN